MNDFKNTDNLFSKIKEDFSSFNNSGLIDSGRFYNDVKYIINLLGINWYLSKEDILEVNNYKVKLPNDFKLLEFAYKCTCNTILHNDPGILLTQQTFDHYDLFDKDWHSKQCSDMCCKPPENCIFNSYEQILVQRGNDTYRYSNPILLKLGNVNTKKNCITNCVNVFSNSSDSISIENEYMHTNFCDGTIYLSYNAFPIDEESGLPLIPDNSRVEKAIEYYIKKNIIESLWVNGDADVQQKVQYFNQQYTIALSDAVYETKLPTFNNLVDKIRKNRKSLNTYFQITNAK